MRKDEAVGNKKRMQVCLPKHNYLDNNLLTVEPRAVDPHCFDVDADPDPDPGGGGVGQQKNVHPPGKILGMPLTRIIKFSCLSPRVSDQYSFFPAPDPDPAVEAGDQSGSRYIPDPGL
jgi:hypothetical protein